MKKGEGIKTAIFVCVILLLGVIVAGMVLKSQTMVIVGVSILGGAAFIASVVFVVRLVRRSRGVYGGEADGAGGLDEEYEISRRRIREDERDRERKARRKPVREIIKNTALLGGFLASCVLFIVFCAIGEFMLGFIIWCCGVGLTLLVLIVLVVREKIADSGLNRRVERRREDKERERERMRDDYEQDDFIEQERVSAEKPRKRESVRTARERGDDSNEQPAAGVERLDDTADGRYRLVEAVVRSCERIRTENDTVDCDGQTYPRTYGLYRLSLQSGRELRTAICAAPLRRGEFVNALFMIGGNAAAVVRGSEMRFSDGKYIFDGGKVRTCVVDISSMMDKRRRTGDASSSGPWATDPDYRYIVSVDVGGKRVRVESDIYYTEGMGIDVLTRGGCGVAVYYN